jgi:DNA-binding transcriptional LysR family regulator
LAISNEAVDAYREGARARQRMASLREGLIDLGIGVLGESAPEGRTRMLFRDGFVGVARAGHRLLAGRKITLQRCADCSHVVATQRTNHRAGRSCLGNTRAERTAIAVMPGFPDPVRIARCSDLIALVARSSLAASRGPVMGQLGAFRASSCRSARPRSQCRRCGIPAHGWRCGPSLAAQHGDCGVPE